MTPLPVTAVTRHETEVTGPAEPPKLAEYPWLVPVTWHRVPPGPIVNTLLVPASTPISVISMLAGEHSRAAALKQPSAPGSALRAWVLASSRWVTALPQLACGSRAGLTASHVISPPAAAAAAAQTTMRSRHGKCLPGFPLNAPPPRSADGNWTNRAYLGFRRPAGQHLG